MKKGYHPYLRNVPATPSRRALELDQEEYDSSDDEAVDRVYLGAREISRRKLLEMLKEERRKRKQLEEFIKKLME